MDNLNKMMGISAAHTQGANIEKSVTQVVRTDTDSNTARAMVSLASAQMGLSRVVSDMNTAGTMASSVKALTKFSGAFDNMNTARTMTSSVKALAKLSGAFDNMNTAGTIASSVKALAKFSGTFDNMNTAGTIASSVKALAKFSGAFDNMNAAGTVASSIKALTKFSSAFDNVNSAGLKSAATISSMINEISTKSISRMASLQFAPLVDGIASTIEADSIVDIDNLNDEEISLSFQELNAEIENIDIVDKKENKENVQQKTVSAIQNWAQKYPIFAFLLIYIIVNPWYNQVSTCVTEYVTDKIIHIKEQPTPKSTIIHTIPSDSEFLVDPTKPYWLEIEYINQETGEIVCGWVAKKQITSNDNKKLLC